MDSNIKNTEVKTYFGQCSCCHQHGYMKSMWKEYEWKGKIEVYAQMLIDCFGLESWYSQSDDDKVCNLCIMTIREVCAFKDTIMGIQNKLRKKAEEGKEVTLQQNKPTITKASPPSSPVTQHKQQICLDNDQEFKVEYLEEDILDEEIGSVTNQPSDLDKTIADCSNSEKSDSSEIVIQNVYSLVKIATPRPRKRKARQPETQNETGVESSDMDGSTQKQSKKLPINERNKTYRQYTTEDLRDCLEAIKSNKMTQRQASYHYGIPIKTINYKIKHGVLEEEDLWQNIPREFIGEIKTLLIYTNITPFKTRFNHILCAFCPVGDNVTFYEPEELKEHTETNHPDRFHKVEFMLRPYNNNSMVKVDIQDLKCNMCDLPNVTWFSMLDHLEKNHNLSLKMTRTNIVPYLLADDLNCAICHEHFTSFMNVDIHMNTHYHNYSCAECGETFITLNRLKGHERIHKLGLHKCGICKKKFSSESNKNRHMKLYHIGLNIQHFKCNFCSENFATDSLRDKHMLQLHTEHLKVRNCEFCGAIFYFNKTYQKHIRRRHSDRNKCTKCNRTYDTPKLLNEHILKNNCVKGFMCEFCNKTYSTDNSLKVHIKTYHKE